MLRTQIYLPESQVKALNKVAAQENISVSEAVRTAIEEKFIKRSPKDKKKNVGSWLLSLAKEAERRGIKGPKDLATNMDKYLYDKDFR